MVNVKNVPPSKENISMQKKRNVRIASKIVRPVKMELLVKHAKD